MNIMELLRIWAIGLPIAALVLGVASAFIAVDDTEDRPWQATNRELTALVATATLLWPILTAATALAVPALLVRYVALGWRDLLRRRRAGKAARIPRARVVR